MEDAEPISLYIDLYDGKKADLEVVSRAAIAWAEAIKEIAGKLEPQAQFRVQFESGTEGSLSLNSVISWVTPSAETKQHLRMIVCAVLLWWAMKESELQYEDLRDWLKGKDAPAVAKELSDVEIDDLAKRVAEHLGKTTAQPQKAQIFRELERDPAVKGVGVSSVHGQRPENVVNRAEFSARSNTAVAEDETSERRTIKRRAKVTLVSPILKAVERSWRFQEQGQDEYGAVMKDQRFLEAIERGAVTIPLRTGVEMEIALSIREEKQGGIWTPIERVVTAVFSPPIDRRDELPLGEGADSKQRQ